MRQLKAFLFAALAGLSFPALAAGIPIKLYKNPNCGCCNTYVDYLEGNGFEVEAINTTDMVSIKTKHGVPAALEGCHTAIARLYVFEYVFEGLIPADLVKKVLSENRPIKGISLPGMPTGAPGMPGRKTGPLHVYYISNTSPPPKFASF